VGRLFQGNADAVEETAEAFALQFEVPGWTKEELKVRVAPDFVSVVGEKKEAVQGRASRYEAEWIPPEDISPDSVTAELRNGLLAVTVKKATLAQARDVPIK
jgi:HSP20 family molecular chaperone IbpA